jgi:hypothetical protein
MELVLTKVPTKALYKLQVSVVREVKSRERTYEINLDIEKE